MAEDFMNRVRIYYDAEFTGLHIGTTLISIGLVSQSGAYFYAEFSDYDTSQVDDWLQEHVIDNLMFKEHQSKYQVVKEFWEGGLGNHPMATGARRHINVLMKGTKAEVKDYLLYWLQFESNSYEGKKIQFYTDCYAYDWVLLNDLICEDGKALNLPDFIDYIPIDLSTAFLLKGIDPDVSREEFIGKALSDRLQDQYPFNELGENAKHNSLWDATVACWCFWFVFNPNPNRRMYDSKTMQEALSNLPRSVMDKLVSGTWRGEKDHPEDH